MAIIKNDRPLTLSRLQELLTYDQGTGIFTWRRSTSNKAPNGSVAGVIRGHGYRVIGIDRSYYKASRLAWFYVHGRWPAGYLDHANGVRGDDRLANLREATIADNAANTPTRGRSGVKGVYKASKGNCYFAQIMRHGKSIYLGSYATLDEAAAVRKEAALRIQGNFALEAR